MVMQHHTGITQIPPKKKGYWAARVSGVRSASRVKIVKQVKNGIKFSAIAELETAFNASQREVAALLSISTSTLTRRKKTGHLLTDESDRVVRFANLKDAAVELMQGDDSAAIAWLKTPLDILGGETPLAHATTELGGRDVEELIGRLQHGVFS